VNFLKFLVDPHLVLLEFLNFLEYFLALSSACVDECVSCSSPVESFDTWFNCPVKKIKMFFEQLPLLLAYSVHNCVVVSNNEHYIFSQDSKLFFLSEQL
jgi:hypothetical protein